MNTTEQLREALRAESEQKNSVASLMAIFRKLSDLDDRDLAWAMARCEPVTRHMLRIYLLDVVAKERRDHATRKEWPTDGRGAA